MQNKKNVSCTDLFPDQLAVSQDLKVVEERLDRQAKRGGAVVRDEGATGQTIPATSATNTTLRL